MNYYFKIILISICLTIFGIQSRAQQLFKIDNDKGEYGFINLKGEVVIKPQYQCVDDFFDGFAAVQIDGKWGYIDSLGNISVAPRFDSAYSFSEGYAKVFKDSLCGYIDASGNFVIEPQFKQGSYFSCGMTCVKLQDNSWSFINKFGKEVIKNLYIEEYEYGINYEIIPIYNSGFVHDTKLNNTKWEFFLDTKGRKHKFPRNIIGEFSDDFIRFFDEENKLYGFLNKKGKKVINAKYNFASDFIDGFAWVIEVTDNESLIKFINKSDFAVFIDTITNIKYHWPYNIGNNTCLLSIDNSYVYMNFKGEMLKIERANSGFFSDCIENSSIGTNRYKNFNTLFPIYKDGKLEKYIDIQGNVIWEKKSMVN